MIKFTHFLLLLALTQTLLGQSYLPQSKGEVVEHTYYTLSYIEQHEQAEWVYYTLTPEMLAQGVSRTDNFRADPKVSTQSATLADYVGSGYDRGHLCPAASMAHNSTAMSESFFLSNMSPQHPSLNRGVWKNLEEHVRKIAAGDSILHVVTGPLFTDPIGVIGPNEVTIPRYYYKALYSPKRAEMIGYIMENCKLDGAVASYATTIDNIEAISGINLFADLDLEYQEANIDLSKWEASNTYTKSETTTQSNTEQHIESSQCQGTTSSGKQCSRKAQSGSRFCWQHQQ